MITRVRIEGMSCSRCVQAVFTALTPVEGILHANVGVGWAEIEHDGRASVERIRDAVAVAGYAVREEREERRRLPVV